MKRSKILLLVVAFVVVLLGPLLVHAQEKQESQTAQTGQGGQADPKVRPNIYPIPPVRTEPSGLFGQEHHYSVTFRGNGEAVVLAKILFANQKKEPLDSLTFVVPRTTPEDIAAYQVTKDPVCIRYRSSYILQEQPQDQTTEQKPQDFIPDPNCLEYRDPDYNDFAYGGEARFSHLDTEFKDGKLTLKLKKYPATDQAGAVLISYRATGYAKRNFYGAYDYTFESLKAEEAVTTLDVGISVDADQILRGAKGKVDYAQSAVTMKQAVDAAPAAGISSVLNRYYGEVGQGQILKQASNLRAQEAYIVKGSFADSLVKLYAKEVSTIIFILAVGVILLLVLVKVLFFRGSRVTKPVRTEVTPSNTFGLVSALVIGSFVLSILVVAFTVGLVFLITHLEVYSYNAPIYPIVLIFIAVVSVFFYALLVLVPPIVLGVKRSLWWGVGLFCATVLWLALYLIVVVFFLILTKPMYPDPYQIMPSMNGAVMEKESSVTQ